MLKTRKTLIILICFGALTLDGVFANYAFKKKVKSVCSAYRVPVDAANMDFGDELFLLTLDRQAVSHQQVLKLANAYLPKTIMVQVNVPASKGEKIIFEASCPTVMAIALAEGRMESIEFMQQINLETL